MQLNFESLAELQDFVAWVQAARQAAPIVEGPKATIVVKDLPIGDGDAVEDPAPEQDSEEAPAAKTVTVRKRRTKAEMEAARAAESAEGKPDQAAPSESTNDGVDTVEESSTEATAMSVPATSAPVDKGDAVEFIKSRLAERPEVSQVEHLNLARAFIGKHGMEKYNSSFPLAGLTPNVMGYSPADCATHAAALDFLSLE